MKINLLIVDDIKENIYALEVLFEDLEITNEDFDGLNIFTALSGEEALRITLKEKIDLILLDVRMPGMDGFQVAEILKSSKRTVNIPIVFLTAEFKSEEFKKKGYKVGGLDYFTKPIEEFQFLNKMQLYINLFLAQKIQKKEFDDTLSEYIKLMDKYIISSDTDTDGVITKVSQAFCDISCYAKEELLGNTHRIIRSPDVSHELYKELWDTISENNIWRGQIKNKTKYGTYYWTEAFISPIYDKKNNKIGYKSIQYNITDKKNLEEISITDALTGVFNRRYFDEIAPQIINRSKRHGELVCFAMIDIDYFKKYNDTYGHQKGDEILQKVAKTLSDYVKRADDYCFRIGGEEFCIIFNPVDSKEKALFFMTKLKENIEELKIEHSENEASKYVTISMGLTCKKVVQTDDLKSIYKSTDELLYEAKKRGRNQVVSN